MEKPRSGGLIVLTFLVLSILGFGFIYNPNDINELTTVNKILINLSLFALLIMLLVNFVFIAEDNKYKRFVAHEDNKMQNFQSKINKSVPEQQPTTSVPKSQKKDNSQRVPRGRKKFSL